MAIRGPDVSSWKPLADVGAVKAAGNEFLITKCTGGLRYVNPLYADQIAKARGAGLAVGHYHFLHESGVDPASQDVYLSRPRMQAEAAHFLRHLDWRPGEVIAVDVEDDQVGGEQSQAALWFCDAVEAVLGVAPLIYTYPWYRDAHLTDPRLAAYPLWWAAYDEPERYATTPWPRWTLRQYTAEATVPGIGTRVDMNVFNGTVEQFRALGTPPQVATTGSPFIRAIRALLGAA